MAYEIERKILSNFIHAKDFFGLDAGKFGLDGGDIMLVANSGFMSIMDGKPIVRGIGGPGLQIATPSVLMITFFVDGGRDSRLAREKAQTIVDAFFERRLDENGLSPNEESTVIMDFGVNGNVPYMASMIKESPNLRTTVNCPFLTTETKTKES